MSFLTGTYAIYAPASALNNGEGSGDIKAEVKTIRVQRYEYPYVSAQSGRYWLRGTAERLTPERTMSPIARGKGKQQSFTMGDPITYWDDDLLGYMRAEKADKGETDADGKKIKSDGTLTRISPFRTGTLVAAAPTEIVTDFGVMVRGDGNPVLHAHEFYRATLVGQFSLDLSAVGTFSYADRSGQRNLGAEGIRRAQEAGLEHLTDRAAYRLPLAERVGRVADLLRAFARLEGGAKQTLHYTDVSPAFICMAVLRGGNNPFGALIAPTPLPELHLGVLDESVTAYQDEFQSPLYIGLRQGFMDAAFTPLAERAIEVVHPRAAFDEVIADLGTHAEWFA